MYQQARTYLLRGHWDLFAFARDISIITYMTLMRKGRALAAVFFFFGLLLSYPLIQLFSGEGKIAGIPKSYVGIFGLWLFMIIVFYLIVERKPKDPS